MAIAFGASLGGTVQGGSSGVSLTSLTVSGSNLIILVAVRYNSASVTVSSLNWDNGSGGSAQAFTQLGSYALLDSSNARVSLWYLIGPNTSNSRVILTNSGSTDTYIASCYYTGVAQSSTFTTPTKTENTTNPTSQDTSDANGSWHIGCASSGNGGITPDGNTTQRVEQSDNTQIADNNAAVNSGNSHTLGWTDGGSTGAITAMMRVASTTITLTAAQGSYSLTGQALSLLRSIKITLSQGSYTLTGIAAAIGKRTTMVLAQGSYVLTGFATAFTRSIRIVLAQGSYTLTGQAAVLSRMYTMVMAYGSYTLTGIAVFIRTFFTQVARNITTFSTVNRNSTSYSEVSRNSTNYSEVQKSG